MKNVFFGPGPSIVRWTYTDIINDESCEYCELNIDTESALNKIIYSRRFQQKLPHSLKKQLYSRLLGYDFLKADKSEEIQFVFTCQYAMFFMSCFWTFVDFLKKEFPNSHFAFYYYDIISTCCPELVEPVKQAFSPVLTFDPGDADKYGLEYYGEICAYNKPEGDDGIEPFDVFYAGGDRGRLDIILEAFKRMTDEGRKCIFYVIDIKPESAQKLCNFFGVEKVNLEKGDTLGYKDSTFNCNIYCPYPKALNHIEKCKCLFEVVFPGQLSGSLRLPQACIYKKKLITNCQSVSNRPFFNEQNIQVYSNAYEINTSIIDSPFADLNYDFSPMEMIEKIKTRYE